MHILPRSDLGNYRLTKAARAIVLGHHHQPAGLSHRLRQQFPIAGRETIQVDYFGVNVGARQQSGGVQRDWDAVSPGRDGDIRSFATDHAFAECKIATGEALQADSEEVFWKQHENRVLAARRQIQQGGRSLWTAGFYHKQTGNVGEPAFVTLAMPWTACRKVRSSGCKQCDRTFPSAIGPPAKGGDLIGDLVERGTHEVDELQFENRTESGNCESDGGSCNRALGKRRVADTAREARREDAGESEDATLWVLDIFAEDHGFAIALQNLVELRVQGADHGPARLALLIRKVRKCWAEPRPAEFRGCFGGVRVRGLMGEIVIAFDFAGDRFSLFLPVFIGESAR